jgi:hypothetical protein
MSASVVRCKKNPPTRPRGQSLKIVSGGVLNAVARGAEMKRATVRS